MKKLLLITLLFLITPDAKADMDYVCTPSYASPNGWLKYIKEKCERDNILYFQVLPKRAVTLLIAKWCRHDREINFIEMDTYHQVVRDDGKENFLTCVLYDNEPRKIIVNDLSNISIYDLNKD